MPDSSALAVDDLRADLAKAIEGNGLDDVADPLHPASVEPEEKPDAPDGSEKIEEPGEKPDAVSVKETAKKTEASAESGQAPEPLEAPIHWPVAERDLFAKQSREVQEWLMNRHKAMESDYTRKTQEIAPTRRLKEQLDEILGPHRERYNLQGYDDAGMIRFLVAAHDTLQKNPAEGMKYLAQVYGIDLNALANGDPSQTQLDPRVESALSRVQTLEAEQARTRAEQATQQHEALLNQVNEFADAKDDQGQLLHPFMDDVADDIILILSGARNVGQSLSLQDAYDRACGANPNVRGKLFEAEASKRLAAEKNAAERKRREDADRARRAGSRVEGMGSDDLVISDGDDLRSALTKAYDAHAGGRI